MSPVEEEQVIPAPEPEAPKTPEKAPPGISKTLLGIIVIIALLVVAGAAFFYGSKQKASPTPKPTTTPSPELSPTPSATASGEIVATATPTVVPTPTPTPTPVSQTIVISGESSLDGFEASNGGGNTTVDIRAGRNTTLVQRGFVSFGLSTIPSGAIIEKARLRLYQNSIEGDPYGAGGNLEVDHVNYGGTLDNSAYNMAALSSSFGVLTSNAVIEWKDLDVTDMLKNDIANNRSYSQYRLHFATESVGGTTGDFAYFESAENSFGTGNTPQLVVTYH